MFAHKSKIKENSSVSKNCYQWQIFFLGMIVSKEFLGGLYPDMCIYMKSDFQVMVRDCNKAVISNFKFLKIKLGNG